MRGRRDQAGSKVPSLELMPLPTWDLGTNTTWPRCSNTDARLLAPAALTFMAGILQALMNKNTEDLQEFVH